MDTVGAALLEGRAIAMRNAGTTSPSGRGYSDAFNEWLTYNRFDIGPSHRAKLLVVMGLLPEIEAWRMTLKPLQRARMNHPGSCCKTIGRRPVSSRPWSTSARRRRHEDAAEPSLDAGDAQFIVREFVTDVPGH